MSQPQRQIIIPYRVFEEYVTTDIAFPCFVWHGGESYSYVLPEVTVTADVRENRGEKSLCRMSINNKYNMMAVPASALPRDAIRMYMPRVESLEQLRDIEFYKNQPNPISGVNKGIVENARHLVQKGETIEILSRMYGVSVKNLETINNDKDPKEGEYYNVFPEVNFSSNPVGGYHNPKSEVAIIYDLPSILEALRGFRIAFTKNKCPEIRNMVIRGNAVNQLQNWDEMKLLVQTAKDSLNKIDASPGHTIMIEKKITSLFALNPLNTYVAESIENKIKAKFGYSTEARDFWSPVHIIGSFNLSMRVNADGQTATVAVYDSKSVESLADHKLSPSVASKIGETIETTYQRYVWVIRLR